jgi:hypothetical protein
MTWEVLTYLAHGAQCTIVDKSNYDGSLDRVAFERMSPAFAEVQKKREYFGHRPLAEVAIYYSSRSRDWYGREDPIRYNTPIWGAHRALVQSHIPMGIIVDEEVSLERLRAYPVVYLTGTAIITEKEAALFDQYVSGGGNLLVTGVSGLFDRFGRLQKKNSIQELLGAEAVRHRFKELDNWMRLPGSIAGGDGRFLMQGVPADWPMLVWAPAVICKTAGAQAFGEILTTSHQTVDGPAVFLRRHGKGTVIYLPAAVDAAFVGDRRMPEHRNLIGNLIRRLNPNPPLVIEAPRNVETVVTRDDARKRVLVHFLSFSAPPTFSASNFLWEGRRVLPPMMEESVRYAAQVRFNQRFSKVSAAGPDTKIVQEGDLVRLETANIHEVLVCAD